MYNQPFFIPGYYAMGPQMMRGAIGSGINVGRGLGLFGRLGQGLNSIRAFNWGGFINNASKTLGVINQTIPLVKQVGPVVNNMKSIMRVASVFKDETDMVGKRQRGIRKTSSLRGNLRGNSLNNGLRERNYGTDKENHYDKGEEVIKESVNSPTFFIAS